MLLSGSTLSWLTCCVGKALKSLLNKISFSICTYLGVCVCTSALFLVALREQKVCRHVFVLITGEIRLHHQVLGEAEGLELRRGKLY